VDPLLSGSGQVHEHTSETTGEELLDQPTARVQSRLLQAPLASQALTESLSSSACSTSSSLSSKPCKEL
jgi:hypothetical protein